MRGVDLLELLFSSEATELSQSETSPQDSMFIYENCRDVYGSHTVFYPYCTVFPNTVAAHTRGAEMGRRRDPLAHPAFAERVVIEMGGLKDKKGAC